MHPAGILLFLIVTVAALTLVRSGWEKRQLAVSRYRVISPKLREARCIVFLSDLHDAEFGPDNERLLTLIAEQHPDAVLLGGDMLTCAKRGLKEPRTDVCLHLIGALRARWPVYYAEGNHETRMRQRFPEAYEMFRDHLLQMGVQIISDSGETLSAECPTPASDEIIHIYGVSLPQAFYEPLPPGLHRRKDPDPEALTKRLGSPDRTEFNLLLMHSPLYLKEAAEWGADLVLSGHFHGGTIRLPYLGGLMTPQYQFFVRECAGLFQDGDTVMIVTRGLGTHSIRMRINNLPEICRIDLIPGSNNSATSL